MVTNSAAISPVTASYHYDSDDRRTKKVVNGVTRRTMWSGTDELAENDVYGGLLRRFIPDGTGAMDARLATVTPTGDVYWHHIDHQGSVIATLNSTGETVGVASYSPYGEFGGDTTTTPQHSPFGYTGRRYDEETGLYQYRALYYSPRLGQFLSSDPIGTKDDPNLYLYVANDPVNGTDPTGQYKCVGGVCPQELVAGIARIWDAAAAATDPAESARLTQIARLYGYQGDDNGVNIERDDTIPGGMRARFNQDDHEYFVSVRRIGWRRRE